MPYDNNYNITDPIGTDNARNIDTFIRTGAKSALAERYLVEHYALQYEDGTGDPPANSAEPNDPNAQGRHIPGKVGCLGYGDLADRTALTNYSPGQGALFLCTEIDPAGPYPEGTVYRFGPSGWTPAELNLVGTIYATQEEVDAGTIETKAVSPKTLAERLDYTDNMVLLEDNTYQALSGFTTTPNNNSVPLITQGVELFSTSFTPRKANSLLKMEGTIYIESSGVELIGIFKNTDVDAVRSAVNNLTDNNIGALSFVQYIPAEDVTERTYSLRVMSSTASIHINGASAASYGGTLVCTWSITEIYQ